MASDGAAVVYHPATEADLEDEARIFPRPVALDREAHLANARPKVGAGDDRAAGLDPRTATAGAWGKAPHEQRS